MSGKELVKGLILFTTVILHSSAKAEITQPHCSLYTGNDTYHPRPIYYCCNYRSFPTNFNNSLQIKTLYIRGRNNTLETLQNGEMIPAELRNLEVLMLYNCGIREIQSRAFLEGFKLTKLFIAYNQIEELDLSAFEDLPSLRRLWLHDNPLQTLIGQFPRGNLISLSLANSKLRSIHANVFENLEKLKWLHLSGNQFTTIDWKAFRPLKNLEKVSFFDNPFRCDCHLKFLLDYFDKINISWNEWLERLKCSSSPLDDNAFVKAKILINPLIGKDLTEVNREHVCLPEVTSLQARGSSRITSLECEYIGSSIATVTWRINGKLFEINNLYSIQTTMPGKEEEPDFNHRFVQTLFISPSLFPVNKTEVQFTCQVSNLFFTSAESNAVTVNSSDKADNLRSAQMSSIKIQSSVSSMAKTEIFVIVFGVVVTLVCFTVGSVLIVATIRSRRRPKRLIKPYNKALPKNPSHRAQSAANHPTVNIPLLTNQKPAVDREKKPQQDNNSEVLPTNSSGRNKDFPEL